MIIHPIHADCVDNSWCEEKIYDESRAFMLCGIIIGNPNVQGASQNSMCAYRCAKYGYNTLSTSGCECQDCVSTYEEMITPEAKKVKSELYHRSCWERHYVKLTEKTNDICANHPDQEVGIKSIMEPEREDLVQQCKKYCLENTLCTHLIIDREEYKCKMYKSCLDRKVTTQWKDERYDHYYLMCPNRGGCDWRYRTAALYDKLDETKLHFAMRIARAPWAPFFSIPKTETVWADFADHSTCLPTNTNNFTNKIVLFKGAPLNFAGETLEELKYNGNDPAPNVCVFADQIMIAQKWNATAAFIVLQQKFTLTIFDHIANPHQMYWNNNSMLSFHPDKRRPNIPAGLIIYEYWQNFKLNPTGKMAIGCASQFGISQCVPVNFPNILQGYIFCGCVTPREIKRYDDASQTITLEPCWQTDPKDPGYCVVDTKHCTNYEHHLKKIHKPCGMWCGLDNTCELLHCMGCAKCHNHTFVDKGTYAILSTLYLKYNPSLSSAFHFIDFANDTSNPYICNNILGIHQINIDQTTKDSNECRKICQHTPQCKYYSYTWNQLASGNNCILHENCDMIMMASEPANYRIMVVERVYKTCYETNDEPEFDCKNQFDFCESGICSCKQYTCRVNITKVLNRDETRRQLENSRSNKMQTLPKQIQQQPQSPHTQLPRRLSQSVGIETLHHKKVGNNNQCKDKTVIETLSGATEETCSDACATNPNCGGFALWTHEDSGKCVLCNPNTVTKWNTEVNQGYLTDVYVNKRNCVDHDWCKNQIYDEPSAFIVCAMFIGRGSLGHHRMPLGKDNSHGTKCSYRCAKYGYNTLSNSGCECPGCVTNYKEMITPWAKNLKSEFYHGSCWERNYVKLTEKTNDICANHPDQDLDVITIQNNFDRKFLVQRCKKYCLENSLCTHLIIDREEHKCKLYKSCLDRKITTQWEDGRYDHYYLMCPNRGGCDWRYRTAALYDEKEKNKLHFAMRIARAPWAPFFPIPKTKTVWAKFADHSACSPTNTDKFTNKIVLFKGAPLQFAGETLDELKYNGKDPAPNVCVFADQIMIAQKWNATAAFIVLQQKFTLTIFDDIANPHQMYWNNNSILDIRPDYRRPKIPAGLIIYEYWENFKLNPTGKMAIGCAAQFGISQCVPVNFPNILPGYNFCGCVTPKEIKRYNDASQTITLEPCWQTDRKDPGYCVVDTKHCKNYKHHLKKILQPCGHGCINSCKGNCWGCAHCHNETLVDKEIKDIADTLWLKFRKPSPSAYTFIDHDESLDGSKNQSSICNNILAIHQIKENISNANDTGVQECMKICHDTLQCKYFSWAWDQLSSGNNCILHESCDILMMSSEPANYRILWIEREYKSCYSWNEAPEFRCENQINFCETGFCKCIGEENQCVLDPEKIKNTEDKNCEECMLKDCSGPGACLLPNKECVVDTHRFSSEVFCYMERGNWCKDCGNRRLQDSRSGELQKTENKNSGEDVNTPIFHEY